MNRCQHCDVPFATPSSLKRHIFTRHPSETDDCGDKRTRHQCPHCHAFFARRDAVIRHARGKHNRDLSTCSFCLKQSRADYMPQHKATCARKYWRKIEHHASSSNNADMAQKGSLHFRNEGLSKPPEKNHDLRIVRENTFDARLAADALTQTLCWSEENENFESYKKALVTALRFNIAISDLRRPQKKLYCFNSLFCLATGIDQLTRDVKQINDVDYATGETVLHVACRSGFAELLEPLFWRGACFDAIDKANRTPLDSAIQSHDADTVRFALALGSDPNRGRPLFDAFLAKRDDIMALLVEHGADINQPSFGNTTILSSAVRCSNLGTFRLALSLGADPNIQHTMGYLIDNCLALNCNDCVHEEMAYLLVMKGADLLTPSPNQRTIFHYASVKAHIQLLRSALDRITFTVILDLGDSHNNTALHYATKTSGIVNLHRARTLVSMLVEAGADVNVQNLWGSSPLMLAAGEYPDQLVRLMLDAGATVKTTNTFGTSALSIAAQDGEITVVRLLLEKDPPTHEDRLYLSRALEEAVLEKHVDVVEELISAGASTSTGNILSSAIQSSSSRVLHILLQAGARFDRVRADLMVDLFKTKDKGAWGNNSALVEAPSKCELLIRAFPGMRELYTEADTIRADL